VIQRNRFFDINLWTLFATIVGVIVAVWIWRADLNSHSLQARIASQVILQPDNASSINGLQVSIDGAALKSPYLSVLELSNDGNKPISSSDFEAPLEIRIVEGAVIARAQVTETKPKDIEATLSWDTQVIKLKPLLLNPNDVITISILTSGKKPEFSTRSRIAGISLVPINEIPNKLTRNIKAAAFLISALLLFIASDITGEGFLRGNSVLLRRRAAIFVSSTTATIGAILFIAFLDTMGISEISLIVLSFVGVMFTSIVFSVYWNWNAKSLEQK
jgi:hypothetical protein